jgi:uncharacterized protein (TIGR02145 family)
MTENLNVTTFRNGDPILHVVTQEEWIKAGKRGEPAWCYYDNNPENEKIYGKLYNWYAVSDIRGIAPIGWHVPSNDEWSLLIDNLGGEGVAAKKMKSSDGWIAKMNGTNESGFTALPGGYRYYDGDFIAIGGYGGWWSSTEGSSDKAWNRYLGVVSSIFFRDFKDKKEAFSIRCLKD